jgi:hypothetical protein
MSLELASSQAQTPRPGTKRSHSLSTLANTPLTGLKPKDNLFVKSDQNRSVKFAASFYRQLDFDGVKFGNISGSPNSRVPVAADSRPG